MYSFRHKKNLVTTLLKPLIPQPGLLHRVEIATNVSMKHRAFLFGVSIPRRVAQLIHIS
jgi:hypothetical protein